MLVVEQSNPSEIQPSPKTTRSACSRIEARVLPLTPRQLALVTEADQKLLAALFSEPLEFIDQPCFSRPNAEKMLFANPGILTKEKESKTSCGEDASSLRSRSRELLTFRRFNFARMRVARLMEANRDAALSGGTLGKVLIWTRRVSEARNQIVADNMPLVLAMAKRTPWTGLDPNEMISDGNLALLRCADKFDPSRGFRFSTYACRSILKTFSRIALKTTRLQSRFPTTFDPALEQSDQLERSRESAEYDRVQDLRRVLERNSAELNGVEQRVIRERFALGTAAGECKGKTLEQVGVLIGVTKERVRQIQNKALSKMRVVMESLLERGPGRPSKELNHEITKGRNGCR